MTTNRVTFPCIQDRLSTILAVAEQMLGNNISSGSTKPAFLWVLRDMQLQMKQEPKQEMTEKLDDSQLRKLKRSFREYGMSFFNLNCTARDCKDVKLSAPQLTFCVSMCASVDIHTYFPLGLFSI